MLTNFTIIEMGSVIVSVLGGIAMLCQVISKSRCEKISLFCGLVKCSRKVPDKLEPDKSPTKINNTNDTLKNWKNNP